MLDLLNNLCLKIADPALGWLLHLPRDLAIVIVAIGTSAILTFVRLFTTNQDRLHRAKADKKRLKELIRQARRARDKEARKRHRTTVGQISGKVMAAEGKPLLVSILPIALLAVWCFNRLGYVPPRAGEPIRVKAYYKVSAIDRLTHLVPQEGLSVREGWVQRVIDDPDTAPGVQRNGLAVWTLRAEPGTARTYDLAVQCGGRTYTRPLEVGRRTYAPPLEFYDDGPVICAEVVMDEFQLFGLVPGLPAIAMPPWLVAYLAIAIPFVFVLKHVFRIY